MKACRGQTCRGQRPRQGAALVEFAFVAVIFFMLFFGIVEYCRFIFVRQVLVNAAREGARYAVVNTTDTTMIADTTSYVGTLVAGVTGSMKNYTCQVYLADNTGTSIGAATSAGFGQYVAVQVDCDYDTILPSLLRMNKTFHISTKAMMYSEAN